MGKWLQRMRNVEENSKIKQMNKKCQKHVCVLNLYKNALQSDTAFILFYFIYIFCVCV